MDDWCCKVLLFVRLLLWRRFVSLGLSPTIGYRTMTEQPIDSPGHSTSHTLLDHTPDGLAPLFVSCGEPAFRAKQALEWIHQHNILDYDQMTMLSKSLRGRMSETLPV